MKRKSKPGKNRYVLPIVLLLVVFLAGGSGASQNMSTDTSSDISSNISSDASSEARGQQDDAQVPSESGDPSGDYDSYFRYDGSYPEYDGSSPYAVINNNIPYFDDEILTNTEAFESYSDLDDLGRCGVAFANVCKELMPDEKRGEIGQIKPSGWHTVKYSGYVEGNYLYNRCHLIAYMLAGENANEKNLITGTRYMNVKGMLPFEESVDDYIGDNPQNHVLYRVTPVFTGDNLVADGVLMEAYSVEDSGEGVEFCVFCFNVQPGIIIDYATGDSKCEGT